MISRIRKACCLSSSEWLLLLRAAGLLWRAAWLLRRRSLTQMLAWTERPARSTPGRSEFGAQEISELVAAATRMFMPAGSCLPQSLVTTRLMKQAGYRASVVIGAGGAPPAAQEAPFTAHAWVEVSRPGGSSAPIAFNKGEHEELIKFSKTA